MLCILFRFCVKHPLAYFTVKQKQITKHCFHCKKKKKEKKDKTLWLDLEAEEKQIISEGEGESERERNKGGKNQGEDDFLSTKQQGQIWVHLIGNVSLICEQCLEPVLISKIKAF